MKDEHIAKVRGIELPISTKISVEVCNFIKHKNLNKARAQLERVLEKKLAVPYRRYNTNVAHKPGKIAAGRYPIKAAKQFIDLLNLLQANAENKGLNSESLIIYFASANQGSKVWHIGRKRRRRMKRTHVELRVKEEETKETKKEPVKIELPQEKPKETKKKAPETIEG